MKDWVEDFSLLKFQLASLHNRKIRKSSRFNIHSGIPNDLHKYVCATKVLPFVDQAERERERERERES